MIESQNLLRLGWRETRKAIDGRSLHVVEAGRADDPLLVALRERPTAGEAARLAPPTLILWASDGRFLERHVAEAGLALCDDGRLEFVDDTTHWLRLERPDIVNRRIIVFMAGENRAGERAMRIQRSDMAKTPG